MKIEKKGYECRHPQNKNDIRFKIISDVDTHNTIFS